MRELMGHQSHDSIHEETSEIVSENEDSNIGVSPLKSKNSIGSPLANGIAPTWGLVKKKTLVKLEMEEKKQVEDSKLMLEKLKSNIGLNLQKPK